MKVKDLVSFSKESFFNGAIQTEWFYDSEKVQKIAGSYVFHGPKYYGVSSSDVNTGAHRLIDTASFSKILSDKLYTTSSGSSVVMTIAGYGTGKSHLAVCLGALFSGNPGLVQVITKNISSADEFIGSYIEQCNTKQNLVIVLNGMNNFNLDAEILRCARLSLSKHGISDAFLKKLTKSYDVARHFVEHTFSSYQHNFEKAAQKHGIQLYGDNLYHYFLSKIESDSHVLSAINQVYTEINGDSIAWDRGLSAGDVLLSIQKELCGTDKPFNKILLLFDEFGRYIEYTAANPAIAGEAALQQVFEAIQSANNNIIFVGFIQSELEAYLSRIEKTANITRYLERYRTASENLFLSSNFETILANNIKKDEPSFSRVMDSSVSRHSAFQHTLMQSLARWNKSNFSKSVWSLEDLYSNVILKGCYPLHPITTWLLSNSHQWMQQRSTLAFAAEMIESVADTEIESTFVPYVYPYQIIDSGIFSEMLNSEEKGLVSSQYCMLYKEILMKIGDKLSFLEKRVLQAILVTKIGKMSFYNKDDAIYALRLCSNCKEDAVKQALHILEDLHGVVAFDEHTKTYDLIAEASGFNEFQRVLTKYRLGITATIADVGEVLLTQLTLDAPAETSFATEHHISSTEWVFSKHLTDSTKINTDYLSNVIRNLQINCDGDNARGILLFAYCSSDAQSEIARISLLSRTLCLVRYPIIILFLDDGEKDILKALSIKNALMKFSSSDRERFKKHFNDQLRVQNNNIIRKFTSCVSRREYINDCGLMHYEGRVNNICTKRFTELFTKAVPFSFDGFENKTKSQAKQSLTVICNYLFTRLLLSDSGYSSLAMKDKNRVSAVLSVKSPYSWKVFNDKNQIVEPQNSIVLEIWNDINQTLSDGERHSVYSIFMKYMQAPYGMNLYSAELLLFCFIAYQENHYYYYFGADRLSADHWADKTHKQVIPDIKKITIQINQSAGTDPVAVLCKVILSNTDISNCVKYRQELMKIVAQEGKNETNQMLVAQAEAYLDEGIELLKAINARYTKANALLDTQEKIFNILSFAKVFDTIASISEAIESGSSYHYSEQASKIYQLEETAKRLLASRYLQALSNITCQVTELSSFKKEYGQVAVQLRNHGYEHYAAETDARIIQVESELLAKQKYETSLVECNRAISQSGQAYKYNDCIDVLKILRDWVGFFEHAKDLPDSVMNPLSSKLSKTINGIQDRLDSVQREYTATISEIPLAKTPIDLKQLDAKLNSLQQMNFDENKQRELVSVRDSIQKAVTSIERLPRDIDTLVEYVSTEQFMLNGQCSDAVKLCAIALIDELKQSQNAWLHRYVDEAEKNYKAMTTRDCQLWLERTEVVPNYFQSAVRSRIDVAREKVEGQMHQNRIDSLLAAYSKLTDSEKAIFKASIQ